MCVNLVHVIPTPSFFLFLILHASNQRLFSKSTLDGNLSIFSSPWTRLLLFQCPPLFTQDFSCLYTLYIHLNRVMASIMLISEELNLIIFWCIHEESKRQRMRRSLLTSISNKLPRRLSFHSFTHLWMKNNTSVRIYSVRERTTKRQP